MIDLVNGDEGAASRAEEIDAEASFKAISTITVHEYLRGVHYLYMHDGAILANRLKKAEAELVRFEILPYTYQIAKTAAELDAALTRHGKTVSLSDVIIAATALHYRLTLVTRNLEHFKRIQKLKIETY